MKFELKEQSNIWKISGDFGRYKGQLLLRHSKLSYTLATQRQSKYMTNLKM